MQSELVGIMVSAVENEETLVDWEKDASVTKACVLPWWYSHGIALKSAE